MGLKDPNYVFNWMMKKFSFRLIALGLLFLSSCSNREDLHESLPYYIDPSFTPKWIDSKSPEVLGLHKIPSFNFINQNGKIISDSTFNGKVYVADFFFTSCNGICPKMTSNMLLLQKEFKENSDVLLLSHSVTPNKDSVEVLKFYAEQHGVMSGKWHLVTGNREEIYKLGRKSYFVEESLGVQKDEDEFLHTENFILIDRQKHIRGIYNGLNKASIQQLIEDVKLLLMEDS